MSPVQVADYPDDVRVATTILPTASISSFPLSFTTPYTSSVINVGTWPAVQFYFLPFTDHTRITFQWFAEAAATNAIAVYQFDVGVNQICGMILRNAGQFLTVSLTSNTAGANTADLWVSPSAQSVNGSVQNAQELLYTLNNQSVAGGGTLEQDVLWAYAGAAQLLVVTTAANFSVNVRSKDIANASNQPVAQVTQNVGNPANLSLIIPPRRTTVQCNNNDGGARVFFVTLTPVVVG